MPNCIFCNLEFKTVRSTHFHERYCKNNPNRKIKPNCVSWNKGQTKETNASLKHASEVMRDKYARGELKPVEYHHTAETKKKLSEKRKKYLAEHPEAHNWKYSSKFISKPCEYVKHFLKEQNISFVEEYKALENYNYSIDIAFPDLKVGIEINGDQHYNRDGSLAEYYQIRHNRLEEAGWKIFEILHTKCYTLKTFEEILALDIYDKDYVGKYFSIKEQRLIKKQAQLAKKQLKEQQKQELVTKRINLILNSNIDFTKFGWSGKVAALIGILPQKVHGWMKKNMPEFLDGCFIRKARD